MFKCKITPVNYLSFHGSEGFDQVFWSMTPCRLVHRY